MEYAGVQARKADGTIIPVGPVLYASNKRSHNIPLVTKYIAGDCFGVNKAFMQCKQNDPNPAACVKEGARVRECVADVLKSIDAQCGSKLTAYAKCIDKNFNKFEECRPEQKALEECRPPPYV